MTDDGRACFTPEEKREVTAMAFAAAGAVLGLLSLTVSLTMLIWGYVATAASARWGVDGLSTVDDREPLGPWITAAAAAGFALVLTAFSCMAVAGRCCAAMLRRAVREAGIDWQLSDADRGRILERRPIRVPARGSEPAWDAVVEPGPDGAFRLTAHVASEEGNDDDGSD